jgi:hypothetical protein
MLSACTDKQGSNINYIFAHVPTTTVVEWLGRYRISSETCVRVRNLERFVFAASGWHARIFCCFRRPSPANASLFCQRSPEAQSLARHPVCPNSISALLCLQSVPTTVYCQMLAFGTTFVHLILFRFKEHLKLVVFLGIRTRTSWGPGPRAKPSPGWAGPHDPLGPQ